MQKHLLRRINDAFASGRAHISKEQSEDGSFASLSGSDGNDLSGGRMHSTTFFAANVLSCLNECGDARLDAVRKKTADFLFSQKSEGWSFNYWARSAEEYAAMPYPDDLDDTFAALGALQGYDHAAVGGGALAAIVKMLAAEEVKPGGPYRTWLIRPDAPEAWRDVDVVVNANIAHFLSHYFDVALPSLTAFIDEQIQSDHPRSPYYPGPVQVVYFISRSYKGEKRAALADALFACRGKDGLWGNTLESAMAIAALIDLGRAQDITDAVITFFLDRIEREGWKAEPFCIDPARDGATCYAGSSALTAAFCMQALIRFEDISKPVRHGGADGKLPVTAETNAVWERVRSLAHARTSMLPHDLKQLANRAIDGITDKEIVMLPYLTRAAMGDRAAVAEDVLGRLAAANLYGWIAYTIYDDFLDDEGDPPSLSVANFFLRQLTAAYLEFDEKIPGLAAYFDKMMNGIDAANIWEQEHCRVRVTDGVFILPSVLPFASLENLADRSLGHSLPAVAVFLAAGYASDGPEIKTLMSFFRNYLIVRQLHDDAHDWSEDLARGQINAAGAALLRKWKKGHADISDQPIRFGENLSLFQKFFWREVIGGVVEDIKFFLDAARKGLQMLDRLEHPEAFGVLLDRLEASADKALRERQAAVDFLKHY